MKRLVRALGVLAGCASCVAVGSVSGASAATSYPGTVVLDDYCVTSAAPYFVSITDVSTTVIKDGWWYATDVLTDTTTGASVTYRSKYRTYSSDGGDYWTGSRILIPAISGGIYYGVGHARVDFYEGGYADGVSAKRVIDVCAADFGYTS